MGDSDVLILFVYQVNALCEVWVRKNNLKSIVSPYSMTQYVDGIQTWKIRR